MLVAFKREINICNVKENFSNQAGMIELANTKYFLQLN
ncbi:hypothetical protein SAMN05216490_4771 [Mucilaginibacter mallensis]|uniref:Uncharacterized protein n=1 Tax=Mucilaginibacter mallensis TaxID=652787 RepID=A0A1H2C9J2_MUCMA|nr:hypothetical protein SAMN05216490_4771 [Mucilaginibacter mallensis]